MAHKRKPYHVYKRKHGVYYVRLPVAGGYERHSLGVTNERDAHREASRLADGYAEGSQGADKTLHDAVMRYMSGHAKTLSKRSGERYATSYTALKPAMGHMLLADIGTDSLDEFAIARRAKGVTDRTIRRDLMFVSSVYSQAAIWKWTRRNPVTEYMRFQGRKSPLKRKVRRTRILSHDEEARLELACLAYLNLPGQPSQRHERLMSVAAVLVSLDTGLRRGELRALAPSDFQAAGEHGAIVVRRSDDGDEDGPIKSETRMVPLTQRARNWLDMLPGHHRSPWMFWHGRGSRYKTFNAGFGKLCEAADLDDLTWHDLRRTFGCRHLRDKGTSMERVSQLLGHQSVQVTQDHYAWLDNLAA